MFLDDILIVEGDGLEELGGCGDEEGLVEMRCGVGVFVDCY